MLEKLSRRERQILEILYQREQASAQDVHQHLPDAPSYSAVRALLRILEDKGYAGHVEEDGRYIYRPTVERADARTTALQRLVDTFFEGSASQVVAALLDREAQKLSRTELDRLAKLIDSARKETK